MPIVDFDTYTLNNDNAECWYVLVFDCTLGNFVFRNPCDLLTNCQIDMNDHIDWSTFDWCQMVNSPLLNNMLPGYFLRVNMAGTCIEGVDPTTLSRLHDYRVRCTAGDQEDYLQQKVVGTPHRIIVSLVPGVSEHLQIDIHPDFEDSILPDTPSCVNATHNPTWYAQLVYDTVSGVHRECNQNRNDWYRYQRYLGSDMVINQWDPGFPAWGHTWDSSYWFVNASGWDGLPSMDFDIDGDAAPFNFPGWTNIPGIKIQKTGLYAVWANVDFVLTGNAVEAIRFFVYSNNSKVILVNMKEADQPLPLVPAGATFITRNFSGYNQVYLQEWEYLFLGVRVYTPNAAETFSLTISSQALELADPFPVSTAGRLSGTTFGCALVSQSIQNAS